jgi:hypothetical protein
VPVALKQIVKFRGTSSVELFDIYMDASRHGAALGAPVSVSRQVGSEFAAFGKDGIKGAMLHIVPKRLIVQSWRSNVFEKGDPDSIVTLAFSDVGDTGQIDLFHANIPVRLYENTNVGWKTMYWARWREYLRRLKKASESRGSSSTGS